MNVMSLAEIKDFGTAVMGITPEDNADFWPGRPDSLDDAFYDHLNFFSRGSFSRSQDGRDQFAAFAFIDMKRHKTVVVMVGVEKRQLLAAVGRIGGGIYVQNDTFGV